MIGPGKTNRKGWRTIQLPGSVIAALLDHKDRQDKERITAGDAWEEHDSSSALLGANRLIPTITGEHSPS